MKSWDLKLHPGWNVRENVTKWTQCLNCTTNENIDAKDEKMKK